MVDTLGKKIMAGLVAVFMLGGSLFVADSAVRQEPAQAAANCFLDHFDYADSKVASVTVKNKSTTYVPCFMQVVNNCTFWGVTQYYTYSTKILFYPKYTPYNPWRAQNWPAPSCYPYHRSSTWVNIQYVWV